MPKFRQTQVCVLAPDHADALEERGVIPNCDYHEHIFHSLADVAVAAMRASGSRALIEGWTAQNRTGKHRPKRCSPTSGRF